MKRLVRLGIVAVVIVGLVVALVVLRNSGGDEPEPTPTDVTAPAENPDRVRLLENSRDEIEAVRIERDGEEPLTIVRTDEGGFTPDYEYDVSFVQSSVTRIVSQAQSLSSRRVIGEVEDLFDFGLDDPQMTITVERTDGTSQQLTIGGMTPAQDAYYVMRPDDPDVYSVFNSWIRTFITDLDRLRERTIPVVAFEALERIEMQTLDGREIVAEKIPDWDEDPEMGYTVFAITKPYSRRFQAATNWFETLSGQLEGISIERFVDDNPTNLAAYGLNPPAGRLLVRDEQDELSFIVGDETDGGRFARFEGSESVVVLSGVEPIFEIEPYDVVSAFALIVGIDLVDQFVVESPDARYVGRIERTGSGEEVEESYFLNDVQITEDLFKDLYQWAIGLQFDAEIEGNTPIRVTGEPAATITYELNNGQGERTVSFMPFNPTYVAVSRDGEAEFIMSRAKVNRMLAAFREAVEE